MVLLGGAAAFPLVCKSLEVLDGGCEVKLVARPVKPRRRMRSKRWRSGREMDRVADILPRCGEPGRRAYVCPNCGAVHGVLVYPESPLGPEANPIHHGKRR